MKKAVTLLLLFLVSKSTFAQKSAVSPFDIEDYKILQHQYLDYAKSNPEKAIKIEDQYYSIKKLDSLLLIKDKIKKLQMANQHWSAEELNKHSRELPDQVILPYAFFNLKYGKYNIWANDEMITVYNRNLEIRSAGIHLTGDEFSPLFIFESVENFNTGIKTQNKYLISKKRISTYNENAKYKFRTGMEMKWDDKGNITYEKDWDKGITFDLQDLLKTYRKKIADYLIMKKDSLDGYEYLMKMLSGSGPEPAENYEYEGVFFKIEKDEKGGNFFWLVYITSTICFIFDTKEGNVLSHKIIIYHG
ncbi:hypothetical protein FY557_06135 [Chryseobacterium sp. SN22]|uniref:hypothetical protein n=1 Tax=Chryseobacterium sp. SN22 TaxID=2606431 RepID=UPI0011EF43EE|nr:hypothetical protein [Chryseobacterium sp. SN22]KAA0129141.1 hypothetical protein FY557_06135 [Chryseobacterium sp. SN22]